MPPRYTPPESLEKGLLLPYDHPFSILKKAFDQNPDLRVEVELSMAALLERLNPSERGTRFLTGGSYEWIMAVACWASGIQVMPAGHSQNGFDLMEYMQALKGLWSVKSFTNAEFSGNPRLINKLGSGSAKFNEPTIFISPALPGIVYLDPKLAPIYASTVIEDAESVRIRANLVKKYSIDNPECVIPFNAPINPRTGKESPQLDIVVSILTSGTYPKLGPVMTKMRQIASTVTFLRKQFETGEIDEITFRKMLDNLEKGN
jgi:hypothetical protein